MCFFKSFIVILILFISGCATLTTQSTRSTPTFTEQELKERYLVYVISVKVAQIKFKNNLQSNSPFFLQYADKTLKNGYDLTNNDIKNIIDYGTAKKWETLIDNKALLFDPNSAIHRIAFLLTVTDQENRMPTFNEIKAIALHLLEIQTATRQ